MSKYSQHTPKYFHYLPKYSQYTLKYSHNTQNVLNQPKKTIVTFSKQKLLVLNGYVIMSDV